jgi:hypothetical protein
MSPTNKRYKVALILFNLDVMGGIQVTAMNFAKALIEESFHVDLLTIYYDKDIVLKLIRTVKLQNNLNEQFKIIKLFNLTKRIPVIALAYLINNFLDTQKSLSNYDITINMHGDIQLLHANIVYFHQFNVDYNFIGGSLKRRFILIPLYNLRRNFIQSLKNSDSIILVNSR